MTERLEQMAAKRLEQIAVERLEKLFVDLSQLRETMASLSESADLADRADPYAQTEDVSDGPWDHEGSLASRVAEMERQNFKLKEFARHVIDGEVRGIRCNATGYAVMLGLAKIPDPSERSYELADWLKEDADE